MEKLKLIISVILGTTKHMMSVVLAVYSAMGIVIAVNSIVNPGLTVKLPQVFYGIIIAVAIRLVSGILEAALHNYVTANTKTPTTIAFSVLASLFIFYLYPVAGIIVAIGLTTIQGIIPIVATSTIDQARFDYLSVYSGLTDFLRDLAWGMDEIIQYDAGEEVVEMITSCCEDQSDEKYELLEDERDKSMLIAISKTAFCLIIAAVMIIIFTKDKISFEKLVITLAASTFALRESLF